MGLNRDIPHGILLDPLNNRRYNLFVDTPLGLQIESTLRLYALAALHSPAKVVLCLDDNLQLVGTAECLLQRRKLALGR